jgi:hypothetical protein
MKQQRMKPTMLMADAQAVWARIGAAVPTAKPVSNVTFIKPSAS